MKKQNQIHNWDQLPQVIDLHTVALILGVTEMTVKRWLYDGTLKAKKVGKLWRFDKDNVRRYVDVSLEGGDEYVGA